MLIHWIWFAQLPGLSQRQKAALLQRFSEPEDIFYASRADLQQLSLEEGTVQALLNKDLTEADGIVRACNQKRIGILTYRDAGYPSRLRNLSDAPVVLYYRGVLPDLDAQPVIAVVGTRKATPYGIHTAKTISRQIAACGGLVVSGAAAGVDAASMEGAMELGSATVGVLGCGVDVVYPVSNQSLFQKVEEHGCLLSEYPPGTKPNHWHFPHRNRILSGISHGVLVVEAPVKSGALITARNAMEQGRDVYSVPGNIDSDSCAGSNGLLREGAIPAMSGWDVLREYEASFTCVAQRQAPPVPKCEADKVEKTQPLKPQQPAADKKVIDKVTTTQYIGIGLTSEEEAILSSLTCEPIPVDELTARLDMPAATVSRNLTMLSLKGLVTQHPGRCVSANSK